MSAGARGMWLRAQEHNGRYLLRRPYGRPTTGLYRAAQWLIEHGYARWIRTHMAPGIELTGKPWPR